MNHQRKIRIGRGATGWIPYNRVLHKGCPLSPLLLALLILYVPEVLDNTGRGVKIQSTRVSNILYADDIVIMAKSEMDMTMLLITLVQQIQRLDLKVNFKKSKMMNITQGTDTLNEGYWLVERESGEAPGTLKGVKTFTYIGVQL